MKEATGELNMTVITVVAIAAIAGLFYAFVWPMIQQSIVQNTCNTMGSNWKAEKAENGATSDGCTSAKSDNSGGTTWQCCPPGKGTNPAK